MSVTIRNVILPDGTLATEWEHAVVGGSETQLMYSYTLLPPKLEDEISKAPFETDYWGRIEGVEVE